MRMWTSLTTTTQPDRSSKVLFLYFGTYLKRTKLRKTLNKRVDFYIYDEDNSRMGLMTETFDTAAIRPTPVFRMSIKILSVRLH